MARPAKGDGPWGEAIDYWLRRKNWRQADLLRRIRDMRRKTNKNTISTAARGLDVSTRVLRIIADAFDAPLDAILVSPERRLANEDRRRLAAEIAEDVLRKYEDRSAPPMRAPIAHPDEPPEMRDSLDKAEAAMVEFMEQEEARRAKAGRPARASVSHKKSKKKR